MKNKNKNTDARTSSVFVLEYLDDADLESSDVVGCGPYRRDIGPNPGQGWP